MPILPLADKQGIYRPEELDLLARVFSRLVNPKDGPEARERLASRVIGNFLAGIRDEEELATLSKQPFGR
jgi:hypothetical protein